MDHSGRSARGVGVLKTVLKFSGHASIRRLLNRQISISGRTIPHLLGRRPQTVRFGDTIPRTGDILGYARVSTIDQDLSGQKDRLLRHGAIRVFANVISGKTFNRPGLAALLDQARPNDTLAVIHLDRLGRSLKELLETVDDLKAKEINLISLEERIDTTSAAGELVLHVFGAIAHFERRLISERTKDGLASARKHGRVPGRPPLQPATISALKRPRRCRKICLTSRKTSRHRQINSIQGDQGKRRTQRVR